MGRLFLARDIEMARTALRVGLYFVGPKKPAKFPPNFPQNLRKITQKKTPTSFCRSAGEKKKLAEAALQFLNAVAQNVVGRTNI